jgi:2-oxoglutarate ferredoxin oxidoreductase subunit beta
MTVTYTPAEPIWCAGCGHYGVQNYLERALDELAIPPYQVMIPAGIGCSGSIQNNVSAYGYHALHGRVLPAAIGMALANPELTVIAAGGDGDAYAIGAGHLLHTFKRNPSLAYIVMNNGTYGLTKGQESPTAAVTRNDFTEQAIDAIGLGLSIPGTTFLARGFTRWGDQLLRLTKAALEHARAKRGFAFLEVLSPCVTYNDTYPLWEATLHDVDSDPDYDPTDRVAAFGCLTRSAAEGRMVGGLIYHGGGATMESAWLSDRHDAAPLQDIDPARHAEAYRKIMTSYAVTG